MDKRQLSQLYWLKYEIRMIWNRIDYLNNLAESATAVLSGLPRAKDGERKLLRIGAEISDLQKRLRCKLAQYVEEEKRLTCFIQRIPDAQTRCIFWLRYIEGRTWQEVAMAVGGGNTSDSVRMRVDRTLKEM